MPCNSDYMEPTNKERQLQETAQLLIYVRMNSKSGVKVDSKLRSAANDIYCRKDYVSELCSALHALPDDDFERIVYNARDPQSRKLADWWERHEEADRIREAKEAKDRRDEEIRQGLLKKLTREEINYLMNNNLK